MLMVIPGPDGDVCQQEALYSTHTQSFTAVPSTLSTGSLSWTARAPNILQRMFAHDQLEVNIHEFISHVWLYSNAVLIAIRLCGITTHF